MFIHQLCVELPYDSEVHDVMALVSQRFEHLFSDCKQYLPNTDRKSIDSKLMETSQRERQYRVMYSGAKDGAIRESREFAEYRQLNPRGDAVIPAYLAQKYREKLELRLSDFESASKHTFVPGEDYSWPVGGSLVFAITKTPCRFPAVLEHCGAPSLRCRVRRQT